MNKAEEECLQRKLRKAAKAVGVGGKQGGPARASAAAEWQRLGDGGPHVNQPAAFRFCSC